MTDQADQALHLSLQSLLKVPMVKLFQVRAMTLELLARVQPLSASGALDEQLNA